MNFISTLCFPKPCLQECVYFNFLPGCFTLTSRFPRLFRLLVLYCCCSATFVTILPNERRTCANTRCLVSPGAVLALPRCPIASIHVCLLLLLLQPSVTRCMLRTIAYAIVVLQNSQRISGHEGLLNVSLGDSAAYVTMEAACTFLGAAQAQQVGTICAETSRSPETCSTTAALAAAAAAVSPTLY